MTEQRCSAARSRPTASLRAALLATSLLALSGCGAVEDWVGENLTLDSGSGEASPSDPVPAPPSGADTVVRGSVGDGPVVGALVEVLDASGAVLGSVRSDDTAGFELNLPRDLNIKNNELTLPVILRASEGTDVVTQRGPDFGMLSIASKRGRQTVNITPISTLVVRAAQCSGQALSDRLVQDQWDAIKAQHTWGLDTSLVPHSIETEIDVGNVASMVRTNEVLGEIVRRTGELLQEDRLDRIVSALGCDLVDGVIDGAGPSGVLDGEAAAPDVRLAATVNAVSAIVLLESMSNRLHVLGEPAEALLDAAITVAEPTATGQSMAALPVTERHLIEARRALAAAIAIEPSERLVGLVGALDRLAPGSTAAEARTVIGPIDDFGPLLEQLHQDIEAGPDATLSAALAGAAEAELAVQPALQLSASPRRIQAGATTTITWSASNALSCREESGLLDGSLPVSGEVDTPPLTESRTLSVACIGFGGTVRSTETIEVQSATAAPEPEPQPVDPPSITGFSATPSSVPFGGSATLAWASSGADSCQAEGGVGGWSGTVATSGERTFGPLEATATYTLRCANAGGSVSRSVTIDVGAAPALPMVDLTSTVSRAGAGAPVGLSWTASNADYCTASAQPSVAGWSGTLGTSGSVEIPSLATDTTFSIACTGISGTTTDSLQVLFVAEPTLAFSVNTTQVDAGGSVSVNWSSSNADLCEATASPASAAWTGAVGTGGSRTVGPIEADTTLALTCTGEGGIVNDAVSVAVNAAPPALTFEASASSVNDGDFAELSWIADGADACTASGDWSGPLAASGVQSVGPVSADSTYSIECAGPGGSVVGMQTVVVRKATLNWTLPTQSPEVIGYNVYRGTASRSYGAPVEIRDPSVTSFVFGDLAAGSTFYFAVTAVTDTGEESAFSNEGTKAIP